MRTRTRAISELTYTMSATLNYKKVLDTVLEAGRLGLRMPEREQSSLFAGIFLFHVDDNKLHVVSSRRFTRADDLRVISGTEGIVGQALKEAIPVFGTDAMPDPELQYFVAFQGCKSLLCIPLRAGLRQFRRAALRQRYRPTPSRRSTANCSTRSAFRRRSRCKTPSSITT